jgi:hypothetical protein
MTGGAPTCAVRNDAVVGALIHRHHNFSYCRQGERAKVTHARKITIGVQPIDKVYRVHSLGGAVVDSILGLRLKELPEDYFEEVAVAHGTQNGYRLSGRKGENSLVFTESQLVFTRDHHESSSRLDFDKVASEFRLIWNAANSILQMANVRRIGIVAECLYTVPHKSVSGWLRSRLLSPQLHAEVLHSERFTLRFEERELAKDGIAPDPKKADFHNTICTIYDNAYDDTHPVPGFVVLSVDTQRYFAPVISGKTVPEEMQKLRRQFELSLAKFDQQLVTLGATHAAA